MGLGTGTLREIIELKRSAALNGMTKVVEIGAQQLASDFLLDAGHAEGLELQSDLAPSSRPFWESLGFEHSTIDFDGHRHSYPLDLNRDTVPAAWRNRFDLCVNAGTTKHVANQDRAFHVIHDLVRKGGIMVHELPAAGMLTHGLVTYTMKFFWHLCRENGYEVLRLEMLPGGVAPLPDDIVLSNAQLGRSRDGTPFQEEPIRNWGIFASLRKLTDRAYVTPLDLPPEVMPKEGHASVARARSLRRIWRLWKND